MKIAKEADFPRGRLRYVLNRSRRARKLSINVSCDGRVSVTLPNFLSSDSAENFVAKKADWIFSKLDLFWPFKARPKKINRRREYLKYKNRARELVKERLKYFNQFYGFEYHRIAIKKQRTRWGSCSKKGNLNFNYKIALIPQKQADYILVHELCHLKEFNHSQNFWNLVAQTFPDYKKIRKEIRGC